MIMDCSQAVIRSKWLMPLSSLRLGVVIVAASWLGGHPGPGWCRLRSWLVSACS
jgi:hypothetical protein